MDTLVINDENDFIKLLNFSNKEKLLRIVINKDITFKYNFEPLYNLNGYTIYLEGNNHTLRNIVITSDKGEVGVFSNLKNLFVNNLTIDNSYVYGGVLTGTLCGNVNECASFDNVCTNNMIVSAEAFSGGLVGCTGSLKIENSTINSEVHGYDVVGGIAGMANKYERKNAIVNSTIIGFCKALDSEVGYCDTRLVPKEKLRKRLF